MPDPTSAGTMLDQALTGVGGIGGGGLGMYLIMRVLGKNGSSEPSTERLEDKIEQMIKAQHDTNILLAEIKGALAAR